MTHGQQTIHLVLTLAKAGDLGLLPAMTSGAQREVAERLASLVRQFDYLESAEFSELIAGKSAAVVAALKRRVLEPEYAREIRERLYDSLRLLLSEGSVTGLLPSSMAPELESIRASLEALS